MTKRNRKAVVEDRWEKKKQKGRIVDEKFQHETLPPIQAKTEAQKEFFKSMANNAVIAAIGPAGTGKTYTSVGTAADKLKRGEIDKICISRSYQMMGSSAGLLPGDISMKLSPLLMPMLDVLAERLGKNCLETQMVNGNIEIVPLETLRGRSFDNAVLFIDECFPKGTEVLTEGGFKPIENLSVCDKVYQVNSDKTGEFVVPERIVEKYSENLVQISTSRFRSITTPNHDVVYMDRKNQFYKEKAAGKTFKHHSIPTSTSGRVGGVKYSKWEIAYACAMQADGSLETTTQVNGTKRDYWSITLKREDKLQYFREILDRLGIKHSEYVSDKKGRIRFYLGQRDPVLFKRSKDKTFDATTVLSMDSKSQQVFIEELCKWDGSIKGPTPLYCSTNHENIKLAQTVGHMNGYRCRVMVTNDTRDIFQKPPKTNYRLTFVKTNKITLQQHEKTEMDYKDMTYCVTVPSGMILVRQEDQVFISGNCQNTTVKEMHSIITRIGENTQLILMGDDRQKDIKGLSGLEWFCDMVDKYSPEGADYVEFSIEDCVRSDICSQFLRIIDAEAS